MSELRLSNGIVEVGIPLGFGPRVMRYGFIGEPSILAPADAARITPAGLWRAYGGHRLWAAPERFPETYTLDDAPPQVERRSEASATVRASPPGAGLCVEIGVRLVPGSSEAVIEHVLTNTGDGARELAPWGISVVRPNGVAVIPNPRYRPQPEALLPVRTVALWGYTDLADGRFAAGPSFVRLRCDPANAAPIKLGVACERGWCAYVSDGVAFVVRAPLRTDAVYPDLGSSIELYSEGAFFEVETLGPLAHLAPGESTRHSVRWSLVRVDADDDATLARALGQDAGA